MRFQKKINALVKVQRMLPKTFGECSSARPCPHISCRHNLSIDVAKNGSIKFTQCSKDPDDNIDIIFGDLDDNCSLTIAEKGGLSLEEIGDILGVTRERIRQIEEAAIKKLAKRHASMKGDFMEIMHYLSSKEQGQFRLH